MHQLVRITTPGGRILDPFAGSGSTLLAAAMEGYNSTGIELSEAVYAVAEKRLEDANKVPTQVPV